MFLSINAMNFAHAGGSAGARSVMPLVADTSRPGFLIIKDLLTNSVRQ